MAAPASITLHNLGGRWRMNADLSDPYDEMLKAQGVSWLWRKVLVKSGAELWVTQTVEDGGADRLVIQGKSSNGLPDSREDRLITGAWKELSFPIFGKIRGCTRWVARADLASAWLGEGMVLGDDDKVILMETIQLNIDTVTMQANGFRIIDGERRYVRNVEVTNSKKDVIRVKLVYDYLGPLEE